MSNPLLNKIRADYEAAEAKYEAKNRRINSEEKHVRKALETLVVTRDLPTYFSNLTHVSTRYAIPLWSALADHSRLMELKIHLLERKSSDSRLDYPSTEFLGRILPLVIEILEDIAPNREVISPMILEGLETLCERNPELRVMPWKYYFERMNYRQFSHLQLLYIHAFWSNQYLPWHDSQREENRLARDQQEIEIKKKRVTRKLETQLASLEKREEDVTRFIDKYTRELSELLAEKEEIQSQLTRAETEYEEMYEEQARIISFETMDM